jgi:hypothetical protein
VFGKSTMNVDEENNGVHFTILQILEPKLGKLKKRGLTKQLRKHFSEGLFKDVILTTGLHTPAQQKFLKNVLNPRNNDILTLHFSKLKEWSFGWIAYMPLMIFLLASIVTVLLSNYIPFLEDVYNTPVPDLLQSVPVRIVFFAWPTIFLLLIPFVYSNACRSFSMWQNQYRVKGKLLRSHYCTFGMCHTLNNATMLDNVGILKVQSTKHSFNQYHMNATKRTTFCCPRGLFLTSVLGVRAKQGHVITTVCKRNLPPIHVVHIFLANPHQTRTCVSTRWEQQKLVTNIMQSLLPIDSSTPSACSTPTPQEFPVFGGILQTIPINPGNNSYVLVIVNQNMHQPCFTNLKTIMMRHSVIISQLDAVTKVEESYSSSNESRNSCSDLSTGIDCNSEEDTPLNFETHNSHGIPSLTIATNSEIVLGTLQTKSPSIELIDVTFYHRKH